MTDPSVGRNRAVRNPDLRGRYAPSPTGQLHLGNARSALVAWLSVRRQGGAFVWRIEDLDTPRVEARMAAAALDDLAWLGLDWDEGPDRGGPHAPYVQSERLARYDAAMERLYRAGRLFPCAHSRKDLESLSSAPHGRTAAYPRSLRPRTLPAGWFDALLADPQPAASIRFRVADGAVAFDDPVFGRVTESVADDVGDFVLRRRDGFYAYQLAVVVDDLEMGITEVVRGSDLLWSTPRQIQLIEALGGRPPAYGHVPLVCNHEGQKLSKRDAGLSLAALREGGIAPEQVVGYLAYSLGLTPAPRRLAARDLVARFDWARVGREDWVLPADAVAAMRSVPA